MADNKWIHIDNWMGSLLGLRANDLICYAIIYAFSRDGKSQYRGDLSYLASCMFATKQTTLLCLKKLLDQNIILKQEEMVDGIKRCYYKTNIICGDNTFYIIDPNKKPSETIQEALMNHSRIFNGTIQDSLPVYKTDNKENNKENKKGDNNKLLSPQKSRFKKPTIKEIAAYIEEKKFTFDAERFYDYYESKGWVVGKSPMKDWKAACRTWAAQRKSQIKEEDQEERSGLPAGLTEETWALRQEWMRKYVPRIAERISPEAFLSMQGKSHYNPEIFKDIIIEIDNSDYDGDITQEFIRLCDTDEYAKRLWSGE